MLIKFPKHVYAFLNSLKFSLPFYLYNVLWHIVCFLSQGYLQIYIISVMDHVLLKTLLGMDHSQCFLSLQEVTFHSRSLMVIKKQTTFGKHNSLYHHCHVHALLHLSSLLSSFLLRVCLHINRRLWLQAHALMTQSSTQYCGYHRRNWNLYASFGNLVWRLGIAIAWVSFCFWVPDGYVIIVSTYSSDLWQTVRWLSILFVCAPTCHMVTSVHTEKHSNLSWFPNVDGT
jgi:hypothetical protein